MIIIILSNDKIFPLFDRMCARQEKEIKEENKAKYAFVTAVFGNDKDKVSNTYVPTACVCANALKTYKTKADVICLVTKDVTERKLLEKQFDRIIEVDYISAHTLDLSSKQEFYYGSWKNVSFTKWRCLELVEYDKVIFIDADLIVLENIDNLFELNAPAACFSTSWAYPYAKNGGIYNPYYKDGKELAHGQSIDHDAIKKGFTKKSFVANGGLVLLEPNKKHFTELVKLLDKKIYGFKNCVSMFDEQAITELYYNLGIDWYHIHQIYNFFVGKSDWLKLTEEKEKTFHYYGIKPWLWPKDKWDDLKVWYKHLEECMSEDEMKRCLKNGQK